MSEKQFTLADAQQLVPWLQETFDGLTPLRNRIKHMPATIGDMLARTRSNGHSDAEEQLELYRRAIEEAREALVERLAPVVERGILVKSMELGLVDFPSLHEGRQVYLCWIDGEKQIKFWHECNVGFAGRQPI